MKKIFIKSKFFGWKEVAFPIALDWAKWLYPQVCHNKTKDGGLRLINNRLKGIAFKKEDLI